MEIEKLGKGYIVTGDKSESMYFQHRQEAEDFIREKTTKHFDYAHNQFAWYDGTLQLFNIFGDVIEQCHISEDDISNDNRYLCMDKLISNALEEGKL